MPEHYELPDRVKPYQHLLNNTGGLAVEEILDRYLNTDNLMATNLPLYLLGTSVYAQVRLIESLLDKRILS